MNRKAAVAGVTFALACLLLGSSVLAKASRSVERVTVNSSAFSSNGKIPNNFTCEGANVNPPLRFNGIPANAKSLVLIVDDPDAPGGLFTHWLVWNINPTVRQIPPGSVPAGGVQGTNDFGHPAYGGPCPPTGTHRYRFQVIAVDCKLDLRQGAKRPELDNAMTGHQLARGALTATYSR